MTKNELLAQAEALEWVNSLAWGPAHALEVAAARAKELRAQAAALEAPEPVAWIVEGTEFNILGELTHKRDIDYFEDAIEFLPVGTKLYAATPDQSARIAELEGLLRECAEGYKWMRDNGYQAPLLERIRAALGEKP